MCGKVLGSHQHHILRQNTVRHLLLEVDCRITRSKSTFAPLTDQENATAFFSSIFRELPPDVTFGGFHFLLGLMDGRELNKIVIYIHECIHSSHSGHVTFDLSLVDMKNLPI